jgi:SAM-dependent methyltransferase
MTHFDDEFYRDILEGLAVLDERPFLRDLVATIARHDEPRLGAALNANQMASQRWLIDALAQSAGTRFTDVLVLGGWIGALSALLLRDPRFAIGRIVSVDIDPRCETLARALNATHAAAGRFEARTADMRELDYAAERFALVVNTSCEHVVDFDRWYARVPGGQLVVLQTNDYVACAEHVNCVPSLAAFGAQAPMREVLYEGARPMRRYTRFMRIGRK